MDADIEASSFLEHRREASRSSVDGISTRYCAPSGKRFSDVGRVFRSPAGRPCRARKSSTVAAPVISMSWSRVDTVDGEATSRRSYPPDARCFPTPTTATDAQVIRAGVTRAIRLDARDNVAVATTRSRRATRSHSKEGP